MGKGYAGDVPTAPFGFLRVGAASPRLRVADPDYNLREILKAGRRRPRHRASRCWRSRSWLSTGYTAGDLFFSLSTLVAGAERALGRLMQETAASPMVIAVGLPVAVDSQLFNAAAVLQSGRLLGVVPKTFLPGYKEYYEERWFSSSREALRRECRLTGATVPFGTDILFSVESEPGVALAVEICEDLWVPIPPSSTHAVAGATVILNVSASIDLVGKADYRRELVKQQSGRTISAYVIANAGVHESTTDVVFGGHLIVAEDGVVLAEGERFRREGTLLVTDVDTERLLVERVRLTSFADATHDVGAAYRRVALAEIPSPKPATLVRRVDPHPFVPQDPRTLDERCTEIFNIQTAGLAKRLEHTGIRRVLLGLSGGLDSTLALLVAVRTFELLELPREGILAVTMPAFGTTGATLDNARRLAKALGVSFREIDIRAACTQHITDIGLDPADTHEPAYQNVQARERTQVLMDLANKEGGPGGGDRRPLGAGPRLLHLRRGPHGDVQRQRRRAEDPGPRAGALGGDRRATGEARVVLLAVLGTPVSPELVPPKRGRQRRAEDRGAGGALRAPRLLPLGAPAPRRGAAEDAVPGSPGLQGRLRRGHAPALAAPVHGALLRPAVQALGAPRRPQGGLGQPLAAWRLADAQRRQQGGVARRAGRELNTEITGEAPHCSPARPA